MENLPETSKIEIKNFEEAHPYIYGGVTLDEIEF